MIKKAFLLLLSATLLWAAPKAKEGTSDGLDREQLKHIEELKESFEDIEKRIGSRKSVWLNAYSNHITFNKVKASIYTIQREIRKLLKKRQTKKRQELIRSLRQEEETLKKQLALLPKQSDQPFTDLLKTEDIPKEPEITNPFAIFTGFSYIKTITQYKEEYKAKEEELATIQSLLSEKQTLLSNLSFYLPESEWSKKFKSFEKEIEAFENALHVVRSTLQVYTQRIDDLIFKTSTAIQVQAKSVLSIVIVITVLFVIAFLIKMIIKKYIKDHERYYMTNKIINFINFFIIAMILLMNYIDNVSYLVTVLGFASAGIAIAMKDWFMSVLGWLVIVVGGSIHVGDRIKFQKDGMEYVGDVLDISLFRITLMEDITLTTYMVNRRAGRIIFVPNNYIFTSMIANYSHNSLKTVWDGIDITITFESNHKKATYIAKEICRKYSKGYTDITRKQLNKLRDRYSLKNTNVEPRVFSFAEPNGLRVSAWYLTNAFATLTLRSTISTEIIDAFNKENDIHIAYPTQTITFKEQKDRPIELPPVVDA